MFSKTWRVHSIFTDVKLNKKVIKDYQLFMVVGVLLFIDLVIMTTWQVADPFYRETKQMEPYVSKKKTDRCRFVTFKMILQPHPSSEDIIIIPENEYCASERMTIFVGSIYAYKGLLMVKLSLCNRHCFICFYFPDIWSFSCMGNATCFDSGFK